MAKKQNNDSAGNQRQSRKEILRARKEREQQRYILIAVAIVGGLLVILLGVALVNEFLISPNKVITTVGEEEITLNEWQDRVKYERAQRIVLLEDQLEAFGGDVGIIQQYMGQYLYELTDPEFLGTSSLDQIIEEELICQAAENRGLEVTETEIDRRIEEIFGYFGGESPPPEPTPLPTIEPTPSVTPIAFELVAPTEDDGTAVDEPIPIPTSPPPPTPTPVSQGAYDEEFNSYMERYDDLSADTDQFRVAVKAQICQEYLIDALVEETNMSTEAEQASVHLIIYPDEERAAKDLESIDSIGFLTQWNIVNSQPVETESIATERVAATELIWQTKEDVESIYGPEFAESVFELGVGETSEIIAITTSDENVSYVLVSVSGREVRPLTEAKIQEKQQELLLDFVNTEVAKLGSPGSEFYLDRIPSVPILDTKFLAQPTVTPGLALPEQPPEAGE